MNLGLAGARSLPASTGEGDGVPRDLARAGSVQYTWASDDE